MRKASRLFEIIQMLRSARQPMTAAQIAAELEVVPRSIYRDIAALQAMRVPIEGSRGIGYILRPGFDLPPLMFSIDETEAIVLAMAMLERTGDVALKQAAKNVRSKISGVVPDPLRAALGTSALHAWGAIAPPPQGIDLAVLRRAVRDELKLEMIYRDETGRSTERVIWPIALIYYSDVIHIVAWCELRRAQRTFRTDRIKRSGLTGGRFRGAGEQLRRAWMAGWESKATPKV
jgi:predicted DNA-binding transcriptional regulator YafY